MMRPQEITISVQMPRGMRVVLFDKNADVRAKVRAAIERDGGFVLAGESRDWQDCEVLLERFVPELLLASVTQVPSKFLETLSDTEFPVLVGLRGESNGLVTHCGLYDTLQVPSEPEHVCGLLGRVRSEIYRRKADELAFLVERYVACVGKSGAQYVSTLQVEDDQQTQSIAIEHVLLIAADGNYIRVHAKGKTYEIRDTLTRIAAKLDPLRFVRVHRSFIVNLSHVDAVPKESPNLVKLSNGMEVPIGPNYRDEFESILGRRDRLSA